MSTSQRKKQQLQSAIKVIDRWLEYQAYLQEIPGLSVGIVHDGQTIYTQAFGYADVQAKKKATEKTCYRIASISKTFTATAIMQLNEQGKLQLDDKVGKHVPWFRSKKDKNLRQITIRQLLSHTAGVSRDGDTAHWENDKFPTLQHIKKFIAGQATVYSPIEQFKYSNLGYAILGEIVAAVSGQSYAEYVNDHIIKRAGLTHTSVEVSPKNEKHLAKGYGRLFPGKKRPLFSTTDSQAIGPAAGLVSNVPDLCKYMIAQLPKNTVLLNNESKREMQRIQWLKPSEGIYYGLGYEIWQRGDRQMYGHGAGFSGYLGYMLMDADNNLGIILLVNCLGVPRIKMIESMYHTLHYFIEDEPTDKKRRKIRHADRYEGRFIGRWEEVDIISTPGRLWVTWPSAPVPLEGAMQLEQIDDTTFKIVSGSSFDIIGETIKFNFDRRRRLKSILSGSNPMKPFTIK